MNHKINRSLKTFCPLPWNHISANPAGKGRVCCEGYETLKNSQGKETLWKESTDIHTYFNSKDYREIRRQMLNGERPNHCTHCFNQEDHGVKSVRMHYIDEYKSDIDEMIRNTNKDGSVDKISIKYVDMALGNKCNLKCRMCSPWNSYIIGKDWEKMGREYDKINAKKIFEDKWYSSPNTLQILKSALPHVQTIFTTGGEPMIIQEHLDILEMIVKEGHADHILLRYNSNQTVLPKKIIELWKHFQKIVFNCSIEGYGRLNDYIRYPSRWENLEKNIYFLDEISHERKNIEAYFHTTLQAYNIIKIPELLSYLRHANLKNFYRFPYFIWVKIPEWLSPSIFPKRIRYEITDKILESLDKHEDFFLNYNNLHHGCSYKRIQTLKEFCKMIKNDSSQEKYFPQFIEETKKHDKIRRQSILNVLPDLKEYFA